jgi:hypothetical protein
MCARDGAVQLAPSGIYVVLEIIAGLAKIAFSSIDILTRAGDLLLLFR